jgi:hypothetical protein
LAALVLDELFRVRGFVINANTRVRTCFTKIVNANPSEDLFVSPRIIIGPIMKVLLAT